MKLPQDWSEFIALLFAHRVRFLIVGAHALAANGRPRAIVKNKLATGRTKDRLDVELLEEGDGGEE